MDISLEHVTYIYQENSPFSHKALDNMTMHIPSGSFVAIIGHTGSGKSTLIQHINGLVRPTKGKVSIGDYQLTNDTKPDNMKELRSKVGVVFQYPEHQLFEETIAKDIAFGPENFGVDKEEIDRRVEKTIQDVGLDKSYLEKSPFDLSGGQMRRVAIAGVLAVEPEVLVLDEPTAGLDPRGQSEIMDMFAELHTEKNLTTILVTHSMEDALAYADHVCILNKGSLFMEGPPLEVFAQKEALQQVDLDVPEVMQFLNSFEQKFNKKIPYTKQSMKEIAQDMAQIVKGGQSHG